MKRNRICRILGIMIIIAMISVFAVPGSFAIYRSDIDGDNNVVSAEWNVSLQQTGVNNNLTIIPGSVSATYTLNVRSQSEVDVQYDIVISNLSSGVEVSINGVNFTPESSGVVTFSNAGTILHNASNDNKTNTHTLTFRAANGATYVNNRVVTVNVIAKQFVNS